MNIKNIAFLAIWIVSQAIANAQSSTNLIGFQDTPWGSSVQTVRAKFPQLHPYDACKNASGISEAEARDGFAKQDMNCVNYSVEKYAIDGMNMNLIFRFTVENKLRDVSLDKYVQGEQSKSTSTCQNTYTKLSNFLKRKYGAGEVMPSDSDKFGFKSMGFQNHNAEFWVLGQSQIYLSNSWGNSKTPDLCWVNLTYSPSSQSTAISNNEELKLQCRIHGTEQRSYGYLQKFDTVETVTYQKRRDGAQLIISSGTADDWIPPVATGHEIKNLVSTTNKTTANQISIENILNDGSSKTSKYVTIDRDTGAINFYAYRQVSEGISVIKGSGSCEKVNANVRKF